MTNFLSIPCSNYVSHSENSNLSVEDIATETTLPLSNNILKMKSLFETFDGVSTSNDSAFFYVSSNGITTSLVEASTIL